MTSEYIRGWRQITAIFYLFQCLFRGNWLCVKRELEIISGFAKPYEIRFAPSFWESYQKLFNLSAEELAQVMEKYAKDFGNEAAFWEPSEEEKVRIEGIVEQIKRSEAER